jgi:hypothetical protein
MSRLEKDQVQTILHAVKAAIPSEYGFYLILCPLDLDETKVVAIGNVSPEIMPDLLHAMAESMKDEEPERLKTS